MKYKWVLVLIAICFLVQRCAKQTSPTGGPKDETSPKLVRSNPTNKEVNFKGKEIQLVFDELVQVNNPREQILITPTVGKKFETIAKKNKVTLKLNSPLQDTTTYNINFRDAIQDATEKNPTTIKLAFSTGPHIDSLSIFGTIKDILTDKELSNYTVALTTASDTFNIFKHSAPWITLTDAQGRFSIENLKQGNYFIYAFDDKNRNLVVDSKNEKYGFKSDNINLPGQLDSIQLNVFKLDAAPLKLISSRPTFAYFNIRVSKSVEHYKLSSIEPTKKIFSKLEPDLTTIKVYNTIPDLDSLQIHLEAMDSTDSKIDTLIYLKFQKKESTKEDFVAKIETMNIYESNSTLLTTITFSKPVIDFHEDSIYVQVDSVKRILFTKKEITWNENFTKLTIRRKIDIPKKEAASPSIPPPKTQTQTQTKSNQDTPTNPVLLTNQLLLRKGAAISVENDSIAPMNAPVKIIRVTDYGIIMAKVSSKEKFILQLLDKTYKLIEEEKDQIAYSFENISPGTYQLRLMVDLNKNGKWDAGNYSLKKQPEPVLFYRSEKKEKDITLKANWIRDSLLITY